MFVLCLFPSHDIIEEKVLLDIKDYAEWKIEVRMEEDFKKEIYINAEVKA